MNTTKAIVLLASLGFVLAAPITALGTQEPKVESVTFTSADGIRLTGTLTGAGRDVIILSNQHHATEFLWGTFVDDLAGRGWTVMTYNYRGIGTSEGAEDVPAVDRDLTAAYEFAQSRGARRVVLVGASLGAIVSLKQAPSIQPAGLVLLSVGRGFLGLNLAADPASEVRSPTLLLTSEYDFSRADTEAIAGQFGAKGRLLTVTGSDHGTGLLDGPAAEDVRKTILEFIGGCLK